MSRFFAALCALSLTWGCSELKPEREAVRVVEPAVAEAHAPIAASAVPGALQSELSEEERALVVATIGDFTITLGELERRLNDQPAYVRVRYNSLSKKKEFLDDMVRFELLAMEAEAKGYGKDPDVVYAMKQQMIKKLLEEDLEKLVAMSDVTDADVQAHYEEHVADYKRGEEVRASQIVFDSAENASKVRAQVIERSSADVRRKRQIFTSAVREFSTDAVFKGAGGDLNFFGRDGALRGEGGPLPGPVVEAAFAIEHINDLSPVVEADGRFYVLQLTNRRPAVNQSLDQVSRQIRNKLFRDKRDGARTEYLESLRTKRTVKVNEEYLALVEDPEHEPSGAGAEPKIPGADHAKRMREHAEREILKEEPAGEAAAP